MHAIKQYIFTKLLQWRKERIMHELYHDIHFIEKYKNYALKVDDQQLRNELQSELNAEKPDQSRVKQLSDLVEESKKVKANYEQSKIMLADYQIYINSIKNYDRS